MISVLRALFNRNREIAMYLIFGVLTTIVNWAVYSIFEPILPFGTETRILVAGIISWVAAVSFAFVTNKIWVFRSRSFKADTVFAEALKFFGGRVATGLIEILAVPALFAIGFNRTIFGIEGLPAKAVVSVVIIVSNYFWSKFVAFRTGKR